MNYDIRCFTEKVLTHYKKEGRNHLPWRKTKDPYRILVSEIMLQQTQVDRVIPYYKKFLKRFPNVQSLAEASSTDVLKEWSGLGYNRRAKFLQEAAHTIASAYSGNVPRGYLELRALRGVGDYTAKAVRVFAFDEPEIMLETNIRTALIHEFFPRVRRVSDTKLILILEVCLPYIISPRVWYFALMDYGSHIKKAHGNANRKSKTYVKQKPFKGSLREVRGAVLRESIGKKRRPTIQILVRKTGFNQVRIRKAIIALTRERLI